MMDKRKRYSVHGKVRCIVGSKLLSITNDYGNVRDYGSKLFITEQRHRDNNLKDLLKKPSILDRFKDLFK